MGTLRHQLNIPWHSRIRSSYLLRPSSTRLVRMKRRPRTIMQPSQNSSVLTTPIMLRNQWLPYYKMNFTHHCQHFYFQQFLISQTLQLHPTCMSSSTSECFVSQYLTPVGPCAYCLGRRHDDPEQALEGKPPCLTYIFISIRLVLLILHLNFIHPQETKVTSDPLSMIECSDGEGQVGSDVPHIAFQAPSLTDLHVVASPP